MSSRKPPAEKVLREAEEESKNNTGLSLNIAMNYGGRRELVLAANAYAKDVAEGKKPLGIDESGIRAVSDDAGFSAR
jgi:undecaprenyl diphosphate synthase